MKYLSMKKNYLSRDFILKTELLWYMGMFMTEGVGGLRNLQWKLGNILLKIKWKR